MIQFRYGHVATFVPLLCTLLLTTSRVQAQIQKHTPQHAPGGVVGYVKWGFGNDNAPMQLAANSGMTFVGVGKVRQGGEQLLWRVGAQGGQTQLVQTTARTADLARGTFMNYVGRDTLPPLRLYTYVSSAANGIRGTLAVGGTTKERLPIRAMKEGMAEYAVYPRALSATERMRVESAMALRHGITLNHSYFNSKGLVVRNYYRLKAYNHRVAGIIGDSTSCLYLPTGQSAEGEAAVRVAAKAIGEGASYLWGDNAKRLAFAADRGKRQMDATAMGGNHYGDTCGGHDFDARHAEHQATGTARRGRKLLSGHRQ